MTDEDPLAHLPKEARPTYRVRQMQRWNNFGIVWSSAWGTWTAWQLYQPQEFLWLDIFNVFIFALHFFFVGFCLWRYKRNKVAMEEAEDIENRLAQEITRYQAQRENLLRAMRGEPPLDQSEHHREEVQDERPDRPGGDPH